MPEHEGKHIIIESAEQQRQGMSLYSTLHLSLTIRLRRRTKVEHNF
jgi:hypothetical protein